MLLKSEGGGRLGLEFLRVRARCLTPLGTGAIPRKLAGLGPHRRGDLAGDNDGRGDGRPRHAPAAYGPYSREQEALRTVTAGCGEDRAMIPANFSVAADIDRKVSRLLAPENAAGVKANLVTPCKEVRSVAQKAPGRDGRALEKHRGYRI